MEFVVAGSGVDIVQQLLERAHALGASELHLDPVDRAFSARVRRDGVLEDLDRFDLKCGPMVIGRLKALAELLSYRTDVPQEGRIPAARSGIGVEVRVATYPTLLGERAAVRFDAPGVARDDLGALGLPEPVRAGFERSLGEPEGAILLTGPSGSGKTTTLYTSLRHLRRQPVARSMVSVEDPVERRIEGVSQTEVNPVAGLDFATALRSLLRHDPDVIMVGEIRDRETARIALEAGLTGHLVVSTIHAGTAPQVFARLLEMGIEPFVLTTAVRGVLAQRLVRRRGDVEGAYEGRVLVAEWLAMGPRLRRAILERGDGDALAEAAVADDRYTTLRAHAEALVRAGKTTREEVDRVLGHG